MLHHSDLAQLAKVQLIHSCLGTNKINSKFIYYTCWIVSFFNLFCLDIPVGTLYTPYLISFMNLATAFVSCACYGLVW